MDWIWNLLNTVIAVGALLLAWKVYRRDILVAKKQEEEKRRLQRKAALVHRFEKNRSPQISKLHIENGGAATARNIQVTIDGQPLEKWEFNLDSDEPIPDIPPGNGIALNIALVDQMKARWTIEITWKDDSGETGHYEGFFDVH